MRLLFSAIISIITTLTIVFSFYYIVITDPPKENHLTHIEKSIYIDRTFTIQQKYIIEVAAAEWQNTTKGIVKFKVVRLPTSEVLDPTKSIIIVNTNSDDPDIIELDAFARNNSYHLGWTNMNHVIPNIKIVSSRIKTSEKFKSTILHELGHAIGLSHNEGKSGELTLMYPAIDLGADHITEKDLQKFCQKYSCNYKDLLK